MAAPPEVLFFKLPGAKAGFCGEFRLQAERANGMPLWRLAGTGSQTWLYSGANGKWSIGAGVKEKDFQCSQGWMMSAAPHGGAHPPAVQGWECADGAEWLKAEDVEVLTEAPTPPEVLSVKWPGDKWGLAGGGLAGEYQLQAELANGMPLWRLAGTGIDRYLYSGTNGLWHIGDAREKEKDFQCSVGWIWSAAPHGGAHPAAVHGWEYNDLDKKAWCKADNFEVLRVLTEAEAKAAEEAAKKAKSCEPPKGATIMDRNRHQIGIEAAAPVYKPIRDFMKDFVPTKPCSKYILEDCAECFEAMHVGGGKYLPKLCEEVAKLTGSLLQFTSPPGGDPMSAFAIVCYSFDLKQFGAEDWQNFFDIINKVLQKRDAQMLKLTEGYLHFLLKGLNDLPCMPETTVFYRGVPKEHIPIFQQHYQPGTIVHWSGLSSVSESLNVAKSFAKPGGLIMKVTARSARSIKAYSAFPEEEEALLLPNWEACVTGSITPSDDGYQYLGLVEKKVQKFIF